MSKPCGSRRESAPIIRLSRMLPTWVLVGSSHGTHFSCTSRHFRPRWAATAATWRVWLDWKPPMETSVSAPLASTSGTMYSSLRTLLPPKARPLLTSSRLAHTWAPPPFAARWSESRFRWWTGEGPKVSGWRSNCSRFMRSPAGSGSVVGVGDEVGEVLPGAEGDVGGGLRVAAGARLDEALVQRHRLLPGVGGEAAALEAAYDGAELVEHGGEGPVARDLDRDPVEVVVGGQRRVGVVGLDRGGEAAVGGPHPLDVVVGEPGDRLRHGEAVHGDHDGMGLAHLGQVDLGDHGRAAGRGPHESGLAEPQQRLAHRRTAHAEPGGELGVAHHLARREGAVDDRVAQPVVHRVAQQGGAQRGGGVGNRHAIYCTSRPSGQVVVQWQWSSGTRSDSRLRPDHPAG